MPQVQIQVTEEQLACLQDLAKQKNIMLSDLLQESIDHLLRSMANSNVDRKKRAMAIAGRFHSGLRDLSTRHDEYYRLLLEE